MDLYIDDRIHLRINNLFNPINEYLNINSLRNKINDLRRVFLLIGILLISYKNISLIGNLNINLNINPIKIIFRDYKMFDKPKVSHDLDQEMIKGSFYQYEKAFAVLPSIFRNVVDRHVKDSPWK